MELSDEQEILPLRSHALDYTKATEKSKRPPTFRIKNRGTKTELKKTSARRNFFHRQIWAQKNTRI